MPNKILEVHPWAKVFLDRDVDKAMEELDALVKELPMDNHPGGPKFQILKLVDQIRRKS